MASQSKRSQMRRLAAALSRDLIAQGYACNFHWVLEEVEALLSGEEPVGSPSRIIARELERLGMLQGQEVLV